MNVIVAYVIEKENLSRVISEKIAEFYMRRMTYEEALGK